MKSFNEMRYQCEVCNNLYTEREEAIKCENKKPKKRDVNGYYPSYEEDLNWKIGDIVLAVSKYDNKKEPQLAIISSELYNKHTICPIMTDYDGDELDNNEYEFELLTTEQLISLSKWLDIIKKKIVSDLL